MHISEISQTIYENNKAKGFWDEPRNVGEMLMLVVSELAEGLEAHRKGNVCIIPAEDLVNSEHDYVDDEDFAFWFKNNVKDSVSDEMADAAIRIMDICKGLNIDLEAHIAAKVRYNTTRPYKHGKKY